jgi:hemoglobin/transferrin/lactoferrin receptor protein
MSWLCDIDPAICDADESPIYEYTDHTGSSGVINGRNASNSLNYHSVKVGLTYRF